MRESNFLAGAVISLAVCVVVGGLIWWLFPALLNGLWSGFRASWLVFIPLIVLAIIVITCTASDNGGIAFLIGVLAAGWTIFAGISIPYWQLNALQEASVSQSETPPGELSFRERAPFDVAAATSKRTLGETTGDVSGKVRSITAAGENGEYTTSVVRRGLFQGYESTQTLAPPLYGTAGAKDVTFCDFDPRAKLRFGGVWPVNNLQTAIYHRTPLGTHANQDDAFAVCVDDVPYIYAPLTRQQGFAVTTRVPAGVAIYNGKSGELTVERDYDGELPAYPQSVATAQRESTVASGSLADYWFKRVGWEDTGKDGSDPNGVNRAEFGLASADGDKQLYVTPLNPRGSSSSIVGLGVVDATHHRAGELNDYAVHLYPKGEARQANSAVADSITGGVLQGYQASGLTVFEVVPASDGSWSATIGKKQSILYRASIAVDGTITLRDANGNQVGGTVSVSSDGEVEREVATADTDLGSMTDAELRALAHQIVDELAERSGN